MISQYTLLSIRLFYAAYFAAMGLILPYFPVYLSHLGYNTVWVGILVGAVAAAKVLAPPMAGLFLDSQRTSSKAFLWITSLLACICAAALNFEMNTGLMLVTVLLFGFFWAAVLPLTDGLSLLVSEVSTMSYGRLRVWGSIGFIMASFFGGIWLVGSNIDTFPWALAFLLLFTTLAAFGFPELQALNEHHAQLGNQYQPNPTALYWLLFIAFCMHTSHGAYYGFFSLYMLEAGYSGAEIGLFWILGVVAEIILMWFWSRPLQQTSPVLILTICLTLAALRWFGTGFTTNIFAIILLQLLHAASFAAFHLSTIAWIKRFAGLQRQTSAQGWYSSVGFGLGSTVGIMVCGYIVESSGYHTAFYACTFIALFGLLAVWKLKQQMDPGKADQTRLI